MTVAEHNAMAPTTSAEDAASLAGAGLVVVEPLSLLSSRVSEEKMADGPGNVTSNGSASGVLLASSINDESASTAATVGSVDEGLGDVEGGVMKRGSGTGPTRQGSERWRESFPPSGGVGMMGGQGLGGIEPGAPPFGVQCYTCTVGKKPSQARNYVNDVDEVRAVGVVDRHGIGRRVPGRVRWQCVLGRG